MKAFQWHDDNSWVQAESKYIMQTVNATRHKWQQLYLMLLDIATACFMYMFSFTFKLSIMWNMLGNNNVCIGN